MSFSSYQKLIDLALKEDSCHTDITTLAVFGKSKMKGMGYLMAKENLVLSGIELAQDVFKAVSTKTTFKSYFQNGDRIKKGKRFAKIEGFVSDLLRAERVALNFLQHLSGIATCTHKFVEKIKPYRCQILDTRKTTPGLRVLEKQAVRDGGGFNHRMSLSDEFLIKDNHIAACGGVKEAIRRVKKVAGKKIIEVEAKNIREVKEAVEEKADIILLDNMTLFQIRKAVALVKRKCLLEVSGGVNLKNVRQMAQTGVDRISIGALTHSAPAVDISFEIE